MWPIHLKNVVFINIFNNNSIQYFQLLHTHTHSISAIRHQGAILNAIWHVRRRWNYVVYLLRFQNLQFENWQKTSCRCSSSSSLYLHNRLRGKADRKCNILYLIYTSNDFGYFKVRGPCSLSSQMVVIWFSNNSNGCLPLCT